MDCLNSNLRIAVELLTMDEHFVDFPKVKVASGSQTGSGYTSKTCSITITGKDKMLHLFVKYLPEDDKNRLMDMYRYLFYSELNFYREIYPAILKFQHEKGLLDIFNNVSKYYHVESKVNIPLIILGNLDMTGYVLRDAKQQTTDAHITLALKAYAKLHATSFAMKDQKPELFTQLCSKVNDFFSKHFDTFGLGDSLSSCIGAFMHSLDPVTHSDIYRKCMNFKESGINFSRNLHEQSDDYSVICHGDCWTNNFMYSLDDSTGCPNDVKLLDWQMVRYNSPTIDLVYFFYAVARGEMLDDFDHYMNLYYDTLSDHTTNLGSDPNKLYPREKFMSHLKKFSQYGLTMAFIVNRFLLFSEDEIPNIVESEGMLPIFSITFTQRDVYRQRMIDLVEHFIKKGFI